MGGSSKPPKETTTTTKTEIDPEIKGWMRNAYNFAQGIADQPYMPYTGEMVAGLSPLQQMAAQNYADFAGSGQVGSTLGAGLGTASNVALGANQMLQNQLGSTAGANTFDAAAAQQYMNPYTQSVIDATNQQVDQNLAQTQAQTAAQAAGAGAFGGTRFAVQQAENQASADQLKAQTAANLNNASFQQAQTQFNADQGRQLQDRLAQLNMGLGSQTDASRLFGALAGQQQQTAMQNAQMLSALGGQQQALDQAQLNWLYQNNYIGPQQYQMQQLNAINSAISGVPAGGSAAATGPAAPGMQGPSRAQSAMGGALMGAQVGAAFAGVGAPIGAVIGGAAGLLGSYL